MKKFDLNIGIVATGWNVPQALKELIANAMEEQKVTGAQDPEIFCDENGNWHIRDYGRGMKYTHLSNMDNDDKLSYAYKSVMPGVGLKDAIATFDHFGVEMSIDSKWNHITFIRTNKYGFEGVSTILALVEPPLDDKFYGTDITLKGVTEKNIEDAKAMFLKYQEIEPLEVTKFGEVYPRGETAGEIYINGVKVASEPYYLFTYNLTSSLATVSRSLDRGRLGSGRSAYKERIKSILTHCSSDAVLDALTKNLDEYSDGTMSDELRWPAVASYSAKKLSSRRNVLFLTPRQLEKNIAKVGEVVWKYGKDIVFVNALVLSRIENQVNDNGEVIATLSTLK